MQIYRNVSKQNKLILKINYTQKDRILEYLEYKGITKNKFYTTTGVGNGILDKKGGITADTIEKIISVYRDINLMWLITGVGEMLTENIKVVSEPGFIYESSVNDAEPLYDEDETEIFTNRNGNKFYIFGDDTIKIEVPLLTEPAYAGYVEAFFDDAYIKELPKATFKVDKIGKGNYMAFTVKNNSMWNGGGYDTPGGAEVLGREVGRHLWEGGFRKTDYGFILLTKQNIYHKDIKKYNEETGTLTLGSRNPEVADFEISINDVNQIFNVIKRAF